MKLRQKKEGMLEYLVASGVLDSGDENVIALWKKKYRRQYQKAWRDNYFKTHATFLVGLNEQQLAIIKKAALEHKRSITKYLQLAALKYSQQQYLVPDIAELYETKQLLLQVVVLLQQGLQVSSNQFLDIKSLANRFEQIEKQILELVTNPALLENKLKQVVEGNPEYRKIIVELLKV